MKPNFRDFFNPFEYWYLDLKENKVCKRDLVYTLSDFIWKLYYKDYKFIELSEIPRFNDILTEHSHNYSPN